MNNSLINYRNSIAKSDDEVYDLGDIGDSAKGNILNIYIDLVVQNNI